MYSWGNFIQFAAEMQNFQPDEAFKFKPATLDPVKSRQTLRCETSFTF